MGLLEWILDIAEGVLDSVDDVVTDVFGGCDSYEKESADIYTTERLNEVLFSFTKEYYAEAGTIETRVLKEIEKYCDSLISEVQKLNIQSETYMLSRLKTEKNKVSRFIKGSVKAPLEKRMSLSDGECLEILKMDSGKEKKEAMRNFTQKIIYEALENLSDKVKTTLREQIEDIEEYFSGILRDREKETFILKRQYELILNEKINEEKKEKIIAQGILTIYSSKMIEEMLLHKGDT